MDQYQERYLLHQENKKETLEKGKGEVVEKRVSESIGKLLQIMQSRRSQRLFNDEELTDLEIQYLLEAVRTAPSSCNRQAVYLIDGDKEYLEQVLVGGRNWIDNADKVYLVMASREAYKNPAEQGFMPFLDGGFVGQNVLLMAEALGIGSCFVNPNIREHDREAFKGAYGDDYFCGAIVLGNYDRKAPEPRKRVISDIVR